MCLHECMLRVYHSLDVIINCWRSENALHKHEGSEIFSTNWFLMHSQCSNSNRRFSGSFCPPIYCFVFHPFRAHAKSRKFCIARSPLYNYTWSVRSTIHRNRTNCSQYFILWIRFAKCSKHMRYIYAYILPRAWVLSAHILLLMWFNLFNMYNAKCKLCGGTWYRYT